MGSLLFLVVSSAIFIAFTNEIMALFKQAFSVTWVRVLIPMIIVSFLWVWFDEEVLLLLQYIQLNLAFFVEKLMHALPQKIIGFTVRVLILYFSASIPAWLFYWKISRDHSSNKNRAHFAMLYAFSWLFFAVLVLE